MAEEESATENRKKLNEMAKRKVANERNMLNALAVCERERVCVCDVKIKTNHKVRRTATCILCISRTRILNPSSHGKKSLFVYLCIQMRNKHMNGRNTAIAQSLMFDVCSYRICTTFKCVQLSSYHSRTFRI